MTKGYRFLAIAGLSMMQAACADVRTSTGGAVSDCCISVGRS